MSPTRGLLRLGRAGVLGACCLMLSLAGHLLAGGAAPSPTALIALVVPVACLSVLVTAERAGLARIGLTLGATQVGLHEAFMLLAQPHCAIAAMSGAGHAGHSTHAAHLTQSVSSATCGAAMPMAGINLPMVAAHLAAGAAMAAVLWQGERLLWAFVTWLAVELPRSPSTAFSPSRPRPVAPRALRVVRSTLLVGGVGRRGPPYALVAGR